MLLLIYQGVSGNRIFISPATITYTPKAVMINTLFINIITSSVNYVGRTVDVVVGAVKALISRVALSLSISL